MPEGDVVRRAALRLTAALAGDPLVRAELRWPDAAGLDLVGRTVLEVHSYGKHLLTRLDDDRTLHTHLRMDGSWRLARTGTPQAAARSPYVRAVLATGRWTAVGHKLGMLHVVATRDEHTLIGHLGPDVLADDFPTDGLPETLRRYALRGSTPVGEVLLDQTVVAGLGTVWMAESLYARRIWPWTPADEVADPATVIMSARTLMERSVAADAPTSTGDAGRGLTAWVHARSGRPCRRCGTTIDVGTVRKPPTERPAFFCPTCQPAPAGAPEPGLWRPRGNAIGPRA
ncbi:Fpg/Nei family DNA glycosylase [Actinotalea ferrariae]|uniref:DNA-formamidopyrimidine glycosylase family protein n=1 Tax=Actinotalea ferrariae TaxID=1386098 RepID=UPI001C8BE3B3|nr:DNA-formamidopyrimidine glycosylase family protein [Actinotalea ferrariae]MBX9246992.1 Fpg/Nei family DNA glycosylase [Actinotalea ferrariae]